MSASTTIDKNLINQWLSSNFTITDVEKELQKKGFDIETIAEHIKLFKKEKLVKRQNKGFILLATGAFLGFLSFLLTAANIIPSLHDFFLYGVTIISIFFILLGFYFIIEN